MTILINYAIPADASDWVERMEAACRVIEEAFGVTLGKACAYRVGQPDIDVADRQAFLRKKCRSRKRWLQLFRDARDEASCPEGGGYYAIGGCSYGNKGVYAFTAQFPEVDPGRVEALLVALGDAVHAYCAHYSPTRTARRLNAIHCRSATEVDVPPLLAHHFTSEELRLPRLVSTMYQGLPSPLQPDALGWLNYWSAETAGYIGFPDPSRDGDLLRNAYRTPAGAWLVKLCGEPLDLSMPGHLDRLVAAYDRFPRLAKRAPSL